MSPLFLNHSVCKGKLSCKVRPILLPILAGETDSSAGQPPNVEAQAQLPSALCRNNTRMRGMCGMPESPDTHSEQPRVQAACQQGAEWLEDGEEAGGSLLASGSTTGLETALSFPKRLALVSHPVGL